MLSSDDDKIATTIRRSPSLMRDLSQFALARHGWGDTDGGFGVTYSTDLDEYDRDVDNLNIPNGCVHIYGFWGHPDGYEVLISEGDYVDHLVRVLTADGVECDVAALESLRQSLPPVAEPKSAI